MFQFLDVAQFAPSVESSYGIVPDDDTLEKIGVELASVEAVMMQSEVLARNINTVNIAVASLESYQGIIKDSIEEGGLSRNEYRTVLVGLESTFDMINRSDLNEHVSVESYGSALSKIEEARELYASVEDKKGSIKDTIAKALTKMYEFLKGILDSIFDKQVRLNAAAKKLKEKISKIGELKDDAELKHKTVETAFSSKSTDFSAKAVQDIIKTHIDLIDGVGKGSATLKGMLEKLMGNTVMGDGKTLEDIYRNCGFSKSDLLPSFTEVSENTPGYGSGGTGLLVNGTRIIQTYSTGATTKGLVKIDTDASENKKSEGKAIPIASEDEMKKILDVTMKLIEKISKSKSVASQSDKFFKQAMKESKKSATLLDMSASVRDTAQAFVNYQRNVIGLSTTAVYAALDYVNASVKLYKTEK